MNEAYKMGRRIGLPDLVLNKMRVAMTEKKTENSVVTKLHEAAGEVLALLEAKNASYGDDNLRKFGRFGILVRVSDKVERLRNLIETGKQTVSESELDTWMDIAGYAIQAIRFIREER